MKRVIYLNGSVVDEADAKVSIFDRGFQFGDSIYEVIRCYNSTPFLLKEHLSRLQRSLDEVEIPLPEPVDAIERRTRCAASSLGVADSTVYIQVSRGAANRTFVCPGGVSPTYVLYCEELEHLDPTIHTRGISASILPDIRWSKCNVKSTSLIAAVLSKHGARMLGTDDVIFNRDGLGITESGSGNVFSLKGSVLRTAPEGRWILSGTSRGLTLRLAAKLGLEVELGFVSVESLYDSDEVFITSTTAEVLPVTRIDGRTIGDGRPGPVALRLLEAYREVVLAETGYKY